MSNQDIKFTKAVTDGFQKKMAMLAILVVYSCLQQNVQEMMHNLTKAYIFRTSLQVDQAFPIIQICGRSLPRYSITVMIIMAGLASRHHPELCAF